MTPDDTQGISSHSSFLDFLDTLLGDFHANQARWENRTLPEFLEAMRGFTRDMKGYYDNQSIPVDLEKPGWREFANILAAARIYE